MASCSSCVTVIYFCLCQDEEEEEEFFNQRYARGRDGLISEYVFCLTAHKMSTLKMRHSQVVRSRERVAVSQILLSKWKNSDWPENLSRFLKLFCPFLQ